MHLFDAPPYSSAWISTNVAFARPLRRGIAQLCGSASLRWYTDRCATNSPNCAADALRCRNSPVVELMDLLDPTIANVPGRLAAFALASLLCALAPPAPSPAG